MNGRDALITIWTEWLNNTCYIATMPMCGMWERIQAYGNVNHCSSVLWLMSQQPNDKYYAYMRWYIIKHITHNKDGQIDLKNIYNHKFVKWPWINSACSMPRTEEIRSMTCLEQPSPSNWIIIQSGSSFYYRYNHFIFLQTWSHQKLMHFCFYRFRLTTTKTIIVKIIIMDISDIQFQHSMTDGWVQHL